MPCKPIYGGKYHKYTDLSKKELIEHIRILLQNKITFTPQTHKFFLFSWKSNFFYSDK